MDADILIVGGGHNALTAAAYLARAGRRVVVLERRPGFGGAAASERPWPGIDARLSRYAYLVSLLPQAVVDELGLKLELAGRAVAACAPSARGTFLAGDAATTRASLRAVTGDDTAYEQLAAWEADVAAAARAFWPTVTGPLPDEATALELLGPLRELATRSLGDVLRERIDDPLVRGTVATDGLIGTFASLHDLSLVQNRCFLYHVLGGPWRVPVGGMGRVAAELERVARAAGADLRAGTEVTGIDADRGAVHLADGTTLTAGHVLLGCALGRPPAEGAQLKVNLLLDRLPRLADGTPPEQAFAGTFRVHEDVDQLEAAYAQAARGEVPDHPPAELYCHTLTDRSILGLALAASDAQTLTVFVLHAPARLFTRAGAKKELLERVLDGLDAHLAEPVRPLVRAVEAKTPQELEQELRLPGGHIFHGDLAWPWRPDHDDGAPGGPWGVATAHPRVLVCGAGARRGGGVSGLGGRDAAMALLQGP